MVETVASETVEVLPPEVMVVPEEITYKEFVPVVVEAFSTVVVTRVVPEMAAEASDEADSIADDSDSKPEETDSATELRELTTSVGTTTVVSTSVVKMVVWPSTRVVYGTATTTTLVVAITLVIMMAGLASVVD